MKTTILGACLALAALAGAAGGQDCFDYAGDPGLVGSTAVGGEVRSIAGDGTHLVVAADSTVHWCTLDVAGIPVVVGSHFAGADVTAVDLHGTVAFLAVRHVGISIVDFAVPAAPVELSFLPSGWTAWGGADDVAYAAGHIFWADRGNGVIIHDVSDPAAPVAVAQYVFPEEELTNNHVREVEVAGGACWVTMAYADWGSLDVSDPAHPAPGYLWPYDWAYQLSVRGLRLDGDVLHLIMRDEQDIMIWNEWARAYDVADLTDPVSIFSRNHPQGTVHVVDGDALRTFFQDQDGLQVHEHGNPDAVASYPMGGARRELRTVNGLTYAGRDGNVDVYDLNGPFHDPERDALYMGQGTGHAVVVDDVLICDVDISAQPGVPYSQLLAVDLTDPDALVDDGFWSDRPFGTGPMGPHAVTGERLYARLDGSGDLGIFDLTTRALLGTGQSYGSMCYVKNQGLRWTTMSTGLLHYDFTDPTVIAPVTSLPTGTVAVFFAVGGDDRAYASAFDAGTPHLLVVDLSDPAAPAVQGTVPTPDATLMAAYFLVDDMLWIAGAVTDTWLLYDVSGTGLPTYAGSTVLAGAVRDLEAHRGVLYQATDDGRIIVYDLTDPAAPVYLGEHNTGFGESFQIACHDRALMVMHAGYVRSYWLDCAEDVSAVADPDRAAPRLFHLAAPVPNPFNPSTELRFTLDRSEVVELTVHDLGGRRVRTLATGRRGPGPHRVTWDGRDDAGARLASGVYLARLRLGRVTETRKMTLLK